MLIPRAQLVVLAVYLEIVRHGGTIAAESVRLLVGPLFVVGINCYILTVTQEGL